MRSARMVAAVLVTLGLAALAVHVWRNKPVNREIFGMLLTGVVVGTTYVLRGGSLPTWVTRFSDDKLAADDDPRNLSPKLYLPILLAAIAAAAVLYYRYAPGGHRR